MATQQVYRSAKQEAFRKGLLSRIWALAGKAGLGPEELDEAIQGAAKAGAIRLYFDNFSEPRSRGRVRLSTLKVWQLRQVAAIFGEGRDKRDTRDQRKNGDNGRVVEMERRAAG